MTSKTSITEKISKNDIKIEKLRKELEYLYSENYRLYRELREGNLDNKNV